MTYPVEILDCTLRDGSYPIDFQFTAEDTALICSALESAGIRVIEVAHGLGLGAAREGKGDQAATDEAYLRAARSAVREGRVGAFFIPGIGIEDDLRLAADCGADFIRVGTNVTELDQAEPFIAQAKALGLYVCCNLMKSYAVPAEEFATRGKMAAEFGADCFCLVDSAGGMMPEDVTAYLNAAAAACDLRLGFHGHDNLCMAVANTLAAQEAGATLLDTSLQGLGRSEGNAVTEVTVAILQKRGLMKDADVNALLDLSEAYIRPLVSRVGHSAMGVTTGRAKFHSSFLGRVLAAADSHGVDPRDLILKLCERDQINAPEALLNELASQLSVNGKTKGMRIDVAATTPETPADFSSQLHVRLRELREKASKLGLDGVLNVVVTPYEMTSVSPYVETNYGCAMTNVMLADAKLLEDVLHQADPFADYILLDSGGKPVDEYLLSRSVILEYVDHEMWARATTVHVTALLDGTVAGKKIGITGIPELAARTALNFSEAGAHVQLSASIAREVNSMMPLATHVEVRPLTYMGPDVAALISLSPRDPKVDAGLVDTMGEGALLYDGGIGSLTAEAIPAAEARGVRVVRVDLRPSLAATALELIGIRRVVHEQMGRAEWDGVSVVAGGLIGREGEIIVDSITHPTRVIGVADGHGGILQPDAVAKDIAAVRKTIAEKRLQGI